MMYADSKTNDSQKFLNLVNKTMFSKQKRGSRLRLLRLRHQKESCNVGDPLEGGATEKMGAPPLQLPRSTLA